MLHAFSRAEMLIKEEGLNILKNSKILIIGIGGVGTYVAEGLARCGVGKFVLVDDDDICLTNINRQIHALRSTVGKSKVQAMKDRMLDINPKAEIETFQELYNKDSSDKILTEDCDYVVDAIDMVSAKLNLVEECHKKEIKIISCMGTGNKFNPTELEVVDINKTIMCPLAKVMRKELRRRGVKKLKVLYSKEIPTIPDSKHGGCEIGCICPNKDRTCVERNQVPGSLSFVPSVAGMIIASEVVKDLIGK